MKLPPSQEPPDVDTHVIIYPGKDGDPWRDSSQLMKQIEKAILSLNFLILELLVFGSLIVHWHMKHFQEML